MQTRNNSIDVVELSLLPETDRECHACEDGMFIRDGYELICSDCQYSPEREASLSVKTAWRQHETQVEKRIEDGERPRLVGGYEDAYWSSGDDAGEYEYTPKSGFSF